VRLRLQQEYGAKARSAVDDVKLLFTQMTGTLGILLAASYVTLLVSVE